jgi:response regulator NasT
MASQFPLDGGATILVADDDPLIVTTLAHVLRTNHFEVASAFDSASALEACTTLKPALAIIDYSMPGMNGIELARSIAERTAVPVMFLSAYNDAAIVNAAIAAGAMAYLVKPDDTLQVVPAVQTALQRARELHALRFQTEQLNTALQSGRNISIATGLLMAKFQIGQQEALERLRRKARSRRTRLEAFASELLRATDEAGRLYEALDEQSSQASHTSHARSREEA